jgi:hypothetical protein
VKLPTDPVGLAAVWPSTRPARQSIMEDSRVSGATLQRDLDGADSKDLEPSVGRHRRSRILPDTAAAFWETIAQLRRKRTRLTRQAVATQMTIDRGTLANYIRDGFVPPPPWEGLQIPDEYRAPPSDPR